MKKLAAALSTAMATAVVPVAIAPVGPADVCAGADGRACLGGWLHRRSRSLGDRRGHRGGHRPILAGPRAVLLGRGCAVLHARRGPLLMVVQVPPVGAPGKGDGPG
jgi:hypothetical protein